MLVGGIAFGLIAGLLAGGRLGNLVEVRLRWMGVIFVAVIVRFGTEAALARDIPLAETLRLPLLVGAYLILLAALWINRRLPGMAIAMVGILSNGAVIAVNGGRMPIWEPSLAAAGLTAADVSSQLHILLRPELSTGFLAALGPLSDVIPIPLPIVQNVASVGDVVISFGLAFFLFATVVRTPTEARVEARERLAAMAPDGLSHAVRLQRAPGSGTGGTGGTGGAGWAGGTGGTGGGGIGGGRGLAGVVRGETGLAAGLAEASVLDRPAMLGGSSPGLAEPSLSPSQFQTYDDAAALSALSAATVALPGQVGGLAVRLRHHPYVRLALDTSFSAIWTSGVISLFGDRIHQVALAVIVFGITKSPVALGFVFVAATLPNLLLGPISGTLVDRWDQKQVLVVSDLLRAAVVVLIPIAAVTNILFAYPLVFLVTSISIFFRPAREAIMPRIVPEDELLTANSANWLAENLADIVGYPLAGLFVTFLGNSLPLAFWIDAVTYLASALLILTVAIPPVQRSAAAVAGGILAEMRVGWRFLRGETVLLANTMQAVVAQFTAGVLLAITLVYVQNVLQRGSYSAPAVYALLEAGIGIGSLVGGFAMGLLGARLGKGRMVIAGYAVYGACVMALGLTGNVAVAIALMVGVGISNMVYIIPSQTLFQQRTPRDMIGRVVGMRFSLVFGSLTLAMAMGGFLAAAFGPAVVILAFGALTCTAGLAGLLVPALRNA